MDALSFVVGILVGWVVEWLIDVFYWRRKYAGGARREAELKTELAAANDELEGLRLRIAQHEAEASRSIAEVVPGTVPVATALAAESLVSTRDSVKREDVCPPADDLTIIEGIGPKIADLLEQHDIDTFSELAETDVERLQEILKEGGAPFALASPESWPRQARLAANRDWVKLQALNEQLVGGVRRPRTKQPGEDDDLTSIEGIGPKIATLLKEHGIRSFEQLSKAPVSRLRAILDEAGPSFRLASPDTWPAQARIAANRDWEEFHSLRDRLKAGREES